MWRASALGAVLAAVGWCAAPGRASADDPVVLAAGDIASCASTGDEATAALLASIPGTVLTLGDNAYDSGAAAEFASCYDPSWGAEKARTRPSPGNHEYVTPGAAGYFAYFGASAGDPAQGYYSFDLGAWHLIALNSNCGAIGGCDAGSPEETWLRADLVAHRSACTLAYWHHPRYSSGPHGDDARTQALWQALLDAGADVVLNGHDHTYERFALQDAGANADGNGIREFVVGTGGRSHYRIAATQPNSETHDTDTYGVLKLTLHAGSYDWQFVPVAGGTFTDAGTTVCHHAPSSVGGRASDVPGIVRRAEDGGWWWALVAGALALLLASGTAVRRARRARPDPKGR
jgi:hypothetical protein